MIDRWDRIFRDICREIVCPPSVDEQQVDGRPLEIGWQRDAGDFDEKTVLHAEGEKEFISEISGGGLKRWEIDLGEFTNDLEGDIDSLLMPGGVGEIDIDPNGAEVASAAADQSGFVDLGGGEDFNDTASGLMQNAFVGLDSSKYGLADKWDMVLFSICLELDRPVPYEGYSESPSQNFSGQQGSEHCLAEQGGLPVKMRDAHVGAMLAAVKQSQAGLNLDSPKDEPTLSRTCDRLGAVDRTRFRKEAAANKCAEALGLAQGDPFRPGILQSRPALIGVRGVALTSVTAFLGATAFLGGRFFRAGETDDRFLAFVWHQLQPTAFSFGQGRCDRIFRGVAY